MIHSASSLADLLGLCSGQCVVAIGGGGKTTTLLGLAREAAVRGLTAAVATTTKMWPPESMPLVLTRGDSVSEALEAVGRTHPAVCVAPGLRHDGKLDALADSDIVELTSIVDVVLIEADGSAGRPLKVHRPHEPVLPASATHVLVLAGADALGEAVGPDTVHRVEDVQTVLHVSEGSTIGPVELAKALYTARRRVNSPARVYYVLNKAELVSAGDIGAVGLALRSLDPSSPLIPLSGVAHPAAEVGA